MPNWTQNTLTIIVPSAKRADLLKALEGPADWSAPQDGKDPFMRAPKQSSHEQMADMAKLLSDTPDNLRAQFRADPVNANRPAWMPISLKDIQDWARYKNGGELPQLGVHETVPFSVAKLSPWPSEETFNSLFPGQITEDGWWEPKPEADQAYRHGGKGYIALRQAMLGVKWPPGSITLVDDGADQSNPAKIIITYSTPWAPISDPTTLLWDVLQAHDAKALITWEEEDMNSGWFWINPADNIDEEHTNDHGAFMVEIEDENDPEDNYHDWDHEAFMESVASQVDDPDFFN